MRLMTGLIVGAIVILAVIVCRALPEWEMRILSAAGTFAICSVGLLHAFFERWPSINLDSLGPDALPLTSGGGSNRRVHSQLDSASDREDSPIVTLEIERVDLTTLELVCRIRLQADRALLASMRRVVIGAGAPGSHPSVLAPAALGSSELVLVDDSVDPDIVLSIRGDLGVSSHRVATIPFQVSELLRSIDSQTNVSSEIRIPTASSTESYPDDRYRAGIWVSIEAPRSFYFRNDRGGATFEFRPTVKVEVREQLRHWRIWLKNRRDDLGTATTVYLQRGESESDLVTVAYGVPLFLAVLVSLSLGEASPEKMPLALRSASIFLSLLALRSVASRPSNSFGMTRADVLLMTTVCVALWSLILGLGPAVIDVWAP
ncbi:MAG: hypothetical protein R3E97_01820 [Candidatus Eisenbacteria bacterium]